MGPLHPIQQVLTVRVAETAVHHIDVTLDEDLLDEAGAVGYTRDSTGVFQLLTEDTDRPAIARLIGDDTLNTVTERDVLDSEQLYGSCLPQPPLGSLYRDARSTSRQSQTSDPRTRPGCKRDSRPTCRSLGIAPLAASSSSRGRTRPGRLRPPVHRSLSVRA